MSLKLLFILLILIFLSLTVTCSQAGPRNMKDAIGQAKYDFYIIMFEDGIDTKYYDGPFFVEEDSSYFTFKWNSNIPGERPDIIEGYVPKNPKHITSIRTIQRGAIGLSGTLDYPLNEAALQCLFELPLNNDIETLRLRKIPLTLRQLEDVTNITCIGNDIRQYEYCFKCAYPDSLSWLINIRESKYRNDCSVVELDSTITHDRYGREYYYENYINFIVLGTAGANHIWDFTPTLMDSIYNDNLEHIYVNNDDIIVKLKPQTLGCD